MKTLHLYLLKQIILTLALTVAVFAFVLLLGNVLKDIMALLVTRQATLGQVLKVILLLLPYVLAYALPIGMLTAALLVFGRFSADQELTAVRASGISLVALVMPILLFSLGVCVLSGWFNCQVAPQCRGAAKELIFNIGIAGSTGFLTEDRYIDEIPGMVLYVQKKNGDYLENVRLYKLNQGGELVMSVRAEKGKLLWDDKGKIIRFDLTNAITEMRNTEFRKHEAATNSIPETNGVPATNSTSTTNASERIEWTPTKADYTTDPIDLTSFTQNVRGVKLSDMTLPELLNEIRRLRKAGIPTTPAEVQLHRHLAFSFAPFAFTLIGLPLAIRAHRRETSMGVAFALGLLIIYYSFFILAEALRGHDELAPYLIFWAPNLIFQAIGSVLLWRANGAA